MSSIRLHLRGVCLSRTPKALCTFVAVAILLALIAVTARPLGAAGLTYYAATNGSSSNDGSIGRPLDLTTALSSSSPVKPGDTLLIRGGTYTGMFHSYLTGTASSPIRVRPYPGERPIIDYTAVEDVETFVISGNYTWYYGIEVTNSNPDRNGFTRPHLFYVPGDYNKLINCVAHEGGVGIADEVDGVGNEVYGCLVYYNGIENPGSGQQVHGLYLQNAQNSPTKYIRDNITFANRSYAFHVYGEGAGELSGLNLEGNVAVDTGALWTSGIKSNMLIGGTIAPERIVLRNNYLYQRAGSSSNVILGYSDTLSSKDAVVENNMFVGGKDPLEVKMWQSLTMTGNLFKGSSDLMRMQPTTSAASGYSWNSNSYSGGSSSPFLLNGSFLSFSGWKSATGYDSSSGYSASAPGSATTIVRPNAYEPGRANIVIYNWTSAPTVSVDISSAGLTAGDSYVLRDALNYFGPPVQTGTYSGNAINVPMTGLTLAKPVGNVDVIPSHPAPAFGVFIIQKSTATGTAAPTAPTNLRIR